MMKRVRPFKVGNEKVSHFVKWIWKRIEPTLNGYDECLWPGVGGKGAVYGDFGHERAAAANPLDVQTTCQNGKFLIRCKAS